MPSYFDFRGRKYQVGLHLNINTPSYVFIRAFVKPYDTLNKIGDQSILTKEVLNIIDNDNVKQNLLEDANSTVLQNPVHNWRGT
jgi:hypothetical protein